MSYNQQDYDQLLILIIDLTKLNLLFHRLFHILFLIKQCIILKMCPIHFINYLFLNTIYKLIKEVVLNQEALSNLEIIFFFQLHTININLNKHL